MLNMLVNNVITRQQQIILNIILHIMSKHEDSKYLCHQFYLHLKVQGQGQINKKCQVKSKHEGIKYP